jgi:hypothetical protein
MPGAVRVDIRGADQSAGVTSGIGAPPTGEAPWQPAHFVATTVPTSHGSVEAAIGGVTSGPTPGVPEGAGETGTTAGAPEDPGDAGFTVAAGGGALEPPAPMAGAVVSGSLEQLAQQSRSAGQLTHKLVEGRRPVGFLIVTSSILAAKDCSPHVPSAS